MATYSRDRFHLVEADLFYEDVAIKVGENIGGLAEAYGHAEWKGIWDGERNRGLRARRLAPERIQPGDMIMIPIPWKTISRILTVQAHGVGFEARRDGGKGKRLSWVQTVFQSNQAVPGTAPFCVDGCPPDDNLPFYWTDAELLAHPEWRVKFVDHPSRATPAPALGTTRWRAITSLAVATDRRVTVFDSWLWGFNLTPAGIVTKIGPRAATPHEFSGHLNLLRKGVGTGAGTFSAQGWRFRTAP